MESERENTRNRPSSETGKSSTRRSTCTSSTPSPTGAEWDSETVASGGRSARLSKTDAATSALWRQDGVPVVGSTRYELAAKTRCDVFGRELRMALEWQAGGRLRPAAAAALHAGAGRALQNVGKTKRSRLGKTGAVSTPVDQSGSKDRTP